MKVTSKREVYKSAIFTVAEEEAKDSSGFEIKRSIVRHGGSSVMLAVDDRGRVRLPVGWGALAGGGAAAGIGFTVALLIASLAFHGQRLAEAKLGILAAGIVATLVAWGLFRVIARLPTSLRARTQGRRHFESSRRTRRDSAFG